ncbi:hypothetical protein FA10DRAFT_258390 [Acaromyces ingoldii]|uniref:Uncharacterized protein n=1 Tax=Acaromyces ingoldii TaxID=215250 RepID=A0A316Z030_9BASI|nr:hypothetical protein FA10DRAFT_258390 [Acaromyces ingoldii]PWN94278.1 hypothetical protein FA10DRAFT_258390 [Acaromyces ingoldii]
MKLTLLVMHVLSCWLTFVAHALAAGRQPGTRSPWESPPLSPTSWDHNTKDHRHVVAGHTGTKDSLVSTQEPLSPGTRSFIEETGMRHNAPNVETLVQWNEQYKWPAQHYDPYSHLLPLSEDEDAQHTTSYQPSRVQDSDPESQHYWPGHPPSFYDPWSGHRSDQHTSNARWHYTDDDMKIPPVPQQFPPESSSSTSWIPFAVDNPFGPLEKREPIASIKEEYRLVSEWANKERDKLAANRKTSDINYMRRDESSQKVMISPETGT